MAQSLKNHILKEIAPDRRPSELNNGDSLISTGIVDSLGVLLLVRFIEKNFGVKVQPDELVMDNFESIDKIVSFVRSKLPTEQSEPGL